jgi:hypothetical protein
MISRRVADMKNIKIEWCENFIRAYFKKHNCKGVYTKLMFEEAEKAGLYVKGTYGSPFSEALSRITKVVDNYDINGNYAYSSFELI